MKYIVVLSFILLFSGCSLIGVRTVEDRKAIAETEIKEFTFLLKEGWEIKLYNDKIILVNSSEREFKLKDIFGVLER